MSGTYEWNVARARELGVTPESRESMQALHDWREAWRPAKVRTLLIAESHVRELEGDSEVRVYPQPGGPDLGPYCRLVYCLGYGDSSICSRSVKMNGGTPAFWRIFATVAGMRVPNLVSERVAVLNALRDEGVWLVDACVTGIYVPGGGRIAQGRAYNSLVAESFRRFVLPAMRREPVERIIVIGKMVHDSIGADVATLAADVHTMRAPAAWGQEGKWDALGRFAAAHRGAMRPIAASSPDAVAANQWTMPWDAPTDRVERRSDLDTVDAQLHYLRRSTVPPSAIGRTAPARTPKVYRPDDRTWALSCSDATTLVSLITGPWLTTVVELAPAGRDALRGTSVAFREDVLRGTAPAGPITIVLVATPDGAVDQIDVSIYPGWFEDLWN